MFDSQKFNYLSITNSNRPTDLMPYLPLTLENNGKLLNESALVNRSNKEFEVTQK